MEPAATDATAARKVAAVSLPEARMPSLPSAGRVWSRALVVAYGVLAIFLLDRLALLLMDYWLLESLGYEDVFSTNFWTGIWLFLAGLIGITLAVVGPVLLHGLPGPARKRALKIGVFFGLIAGYLFTKSYKAYLLLFNGKEWGQEDPVFGKDLGFYVFDLPGIFTTLNALLVFLGVAAASSATCSWLLHRDKPRPEKMSRPVAGLGRIASPITLGLLVLMGVVAASEVWYSRYGLLTKDNLDSSIPAGAQFLDVSGFFSTKNAITVSAIVTVVFAVALASRLWILHSGVIGRAPSDWRRRLRPAALLLVLLPGAAIEFAFVGLVSLRDQIDVTPNEPVVQYPYIQRHIDATNTAFGLSDIETKEFVPKGPGDPKPKLEDLLQHPTIKNAPLWPGYNSWLERTLDPEYTERILQTDGDTTIYGPTLATYQQQEKLRPYYDFMDVDTVRYKVKGEKQLFASAVRELPLVEPQPWLAWWGQRFLVFTHGYGLVASRLSQTDPNTGGPEYAARGIPSRSSVPQLRIPNQAVYYGEGSGSMGYSNVQQIKEHDFPTDQGRAEVSFPQDVDSGVAIDSTLKKVVFGWKSRQFVDIFFSDLIDDSTRVHYFRTPLERIEKLAPSLYLDSDPYAVAAEGGIQWLVNGMTTTDRYPYSAMVELGDKSDRRTPTRRPTRWVNYAADSVKGVVNAYTGKVELYKFKDEPIVNTWEAIYPDLFQDKAAMSDDLRFQVQYPVQLMHAQFDDLYIYYHQKDPLTFFSQEDLFDDGDEVVGAILDDGRAVTFSIEPYYWLAETGKDLPASEDAEQFSMSLVFTPESALNLRAIATAYMDESSYGKLSMLEVPKGRFFPGPEQADSAIDQDAFISQQLGLWTRRGLEVIRGHTTPLVVDGEVLYIEPIFIRSKQNPVPQLERVVVVFRGQAYMGETLEAALRDALEPAPRFAIRPGPELGGEPGFREGPDGGLERTGPLAQRDATPVPTTADPGDEPGGEDDRNGGGPPPGRGPDD